MKINALLDVNVVAHETTDEVAVLLDIEAPPVVSDVPRRPSSLQVVLDRSGSMAGAPLEGAKRALVALIQRLDPADNFGLVTFDNDAQVVVAAGTGRRQGCRGRPDSGRVPGRVDRPRRRLPAWAA